MKLLTLICAAVLSVLPVFAQAAPPPAPQSSLITPAFEAICADGVTPHPKWSGYWHLDEPRFARSADALFATMDLRPNAQGEYAIVRIDQVRPESYVEVARFAEPVRDLAFHDGQVWALFRGRILSLNPFTGAVVTDLQTTSLAIPGEEYSAQAFTWAGNRLVIAHGAYGAMAYDPASRSISAADSLGLAENGQLSKVIDVTPVNDHQVAFAVEAVTVSDEPPFTFNGVILYNLSDGATERFAYDRAGSGVLSHARLQVAGDEVIINNWGILQRASLSAMRMAGSVQISWTPVHFEVNGVSQPGELLGDLLLDQGKLVSCAQTQYQDPVTNKIIHKGVVYSGTY